MKHQLADDLQTREVADGVDASATRRTQQDYLMTVPTLGECAPALDNSVMTKTSAGGSTTQNEQNLALSHDATTGEYASVHQIPRVSEVRSGMTVVSIGAWTNQAPGSLAGDYEIGILHPKVNDDNAVAVFRPRLGKVRVDSNGVDTEAALSFSGIDSNINYFGVVVDADAGETRFYYNTHPLTGTADATVAATPDLGGPVIIRRLGAGIRSNATDSAEELRVNHISTRQFL